MQSYNVLSIRCHMHDNTPVIVGDTLPLLSLIAQSHSFVMAMTHALIGKTPAVFSWTRRRLFCHRQMSVYGPYNVRFQEFKQSSSNNIPYDDSCHSNVAVLFGVYKNPYIISFRDHGSGHTQCSSCQPCCSGKLFPVVELDLSVVCKYHWTIQYY